MDIQQTAATTRTLPADACRDAVVLAAKHERIFTRHWINCGRAGQIEWPVWFVKQD